MINDDIVRKIAGLSRLTLTDAEVRAYGPQLTLILNAFQKLADVPTEKIEPLVTPTEIQFAPRPDDLLKDVIGAEASLANAPERSGNLFKVPPVV